MRLPLLAASTLLLLVSAPGAEAADLPLPAYRRAPVVVAAGRAAPLPVLVEEAPPLLPLEYSRFTGQPLTVLYNDPRSFPGAVDPGLRLVPLPGARRFHTQAVYPRGY